MSTCLERGHELVPGPFRKENKVTKKEELCIGRSKGIQNRTKLYRIEEISKAERVFLSHVWCTSCPSYLLSTTHTWALWIKSNKYPLECIAEIK